VTTQKIHYLEKCWVF